MAAIKIPNLFSLTYSLANPCEQLSLVMVVGDIMYNPDAGSTANLLPFIISIPKLALTSVN